MKPLQEGGGPTINEAKKKHEDSDTLQPNFEGEEEVTDLVPNMETNLDGGFGAVLPVPDMLSSTSTVRFVSAKSAQKADECTGE